MICALCQEREANKKNTHYLTDGIIRSCLNQDGSGEREKGYYFNISSSSVFTEFNFQRNTSVDIVEQSLGREPTIEEIEKAKKIPFSVDNIFCNICEDIFTSIENPFIVSILPKFRNSNLCEVSEINISDIKEIRLFSYLQLWRTHICQDVLKLPDNIAENLRQLIFNYQTASISELTNLPLSITYLQTLGESIENTSNFVSFTNDKNPFVIIMNDFVIQFYESNEAIRFFDFYGLNAECNYCDFINQNEVEFKVKILKNKKRLEFLYAFVYSEKAKSTLQSFVVNFNKIWLSLFGINPPAHIIQEYIIEITGIGSDEFDALKYSKERIFDITKKFLLRKNINYQ